LAPTSAKSDSKDSGAVQPTIAPTIVPATTAMLVPSAESGSRSTVIADSTQANSLDALVASLAEDLASVWYGQGGQTR
jgi:hypothetical protein